MYNTEEIKTFPDGPGCYIMKNKDEKIIYVGKAKNLRKRVSQYFNGQDKRLKIDSLRKNIEVIEFVATNNELEALILENNLIKENRPQYNTVLKDDRTYPYIKITNEKYPKILIVKRIENDKAFYFGPYADQTKAKQIVETLQSEYKLVLCNKMSKTGCIYSQLDQCLAPCTKNCSEEYQKNVEKCKKVLNGKYEELIEKLTNDMNVSSTQLEFEKCAEIRDKISAIKYIKQHQIADNKKDNNEDIIVSKENVVVVFKVRNGKLCEKRHFLMDGDENIIENFIMQFYNNATAPSKEIILLEKLDNEGIIKEYFKKNFEINVNFVIPKKGEKKKLIELATKNAELIYSENKRKEETKTSIHVDGIKHLEEKLGFEIKRIESFDISNISGTNNVCGMTVFENNSFNKKAYRLFKLETEGNNDYGCMSEAIKRRFKDTEILPSVLFIDGGLGHVNAVLDTLKELNIEINVCGMVKDDNHRSRGIIYNGKEITLDKTSPEFKLLTEIQDKTHNFAINYHKLLRGKAQTKSIFDDIKGIGPKKKEILLKEFKNLDELRNLSIEEIKTRTGFNEELITEIKKRIKKSPD